jgi:hypothetical protein
MINVLLYTEVADLQLVADGLNIPVSVSEIPEMEDANFNVIFEDETDLIALADELDILDNKFEVGGVWNFDGTPYIFDVSETDKKAKFDFKLDKYYKKLKAKKVEDGVDVDGKIKYKYEPYTKEESKTKQVNKFYGWGDRDISADVI